MCIHAVQTLRLFSTAIAGLRLSLSSVRASERVRAGGEHGGSNGEIITSRPICQGEHGASRAGNPKSFFRRRESTMRGSEIREAGSGSFLERGWRRERPAREEIKEIRQPLRFVPGRAETAAGLKCSNHAGPRVGMIGCCDSTVSTPVPTAHSRPSKRFSVFSGNSGAAPIHEMLFGDASWQRRPRP